VTGITRWGGPQSGKISALKFHFAFKKMRCHVERSEAESKHLRPLLICTWNAIYTIDLATFT